MTRVAMEASGIYSLDVALALEGAEGIEVMVANPRSVHAFANALKTRLKTDPVDAEVLVLSQQWFRRFTADAPAYAARLLLNLSSLLSRRLVDRTHAWLDAVEAKSHETPRGEFRDLT